MKNQYKILIVEDNEEMRENISEILSISNYNVRTAEDGLKGIQAAREFNPDLIISDIMMPNLDGLGMLNIIQNDENLSHIPLIFLTAKTDKDDFRKGMNLGAEDYLIKPFEANDLLEVIKIKLKKYHKIHQSKSRTIEGVFNEEVLLKNQKIKDTLNSCEKKTYGKGSIIWQTEDFMNNLYFLESGLTKEYIETVAIKDLILKFSKGPRFIGLDRIYQKKHNTILEIVEESKLIAIPKKIFEEIIETENLVISYHAYIDHTIQELHERLSINSYGNVREKVCYHLIKLFSLFEETPISISREDLASYCGMAKETLIRMLSELKDEKLIQLNPEGIKLINKNKLSAEF